MSNTSSSDSRAPITGTGDRPLDINPGSDPFDAFARWFEEASRAGIELAEAVALATATPDGRPSVRMVLLKGFDRRGFAFYTNYESRKARELEANPRAALCFHWKELDRQVRIDGSIERVSEEESQAYFDTRPEGSRVGAWASSQSRFLDDRADLQRRVQEVRERFAHRTIPLPPHWGGYRLIPEDMEFWQGRADRLHDRLAFRRDGDGWRAQRLYP